MRVARRAARLCVLAVLSCGAMIVTSHVANAAIATVTTVDASVNAVSGDVRISAFVGACAPSGTPSESGIIQFFDGATLVGTITLGLAPPQSFTPCAGGVMIFNGNLPPLTLPAVSPGIHSYTATYVGDATYLLSTSSAFTLTVPPRTALATTTVVDASVDAISRDVRITAFVNACAPTGAPYETGTLQFFDGGTLLANVVLGLAPPQSFMPCDGGVTVFNGRLPPLTLPSVSPGTHLYTATYSGDLTYLPSTSVGFALTVPGGPNFASPVAVPTMSDRSLWLLELLIGLAAGFAICRPNRRIRATK